MPRNLREILALPQTDAEQEIADRHIAAETARIRSTWSETEFRLRAGFERRVTPYELPSCTDVLSAFYTR